MVRLEHLKKSFHTLNIVDMILTTANIAFLIWMIVSFGKYISTAYGKTVAFSLYSTAATKIFDFVNPILGFLGVVKENHSMLVLFYYLLSCDIFTSVLFLIGPFVLKEVVRGMDTKPWNDSFENFNSSKELQTIADYAHQDFKCCGGYNYKEWGQDIPESCCKKRLKGDEICPYDDLFKDGCWAKIKKTVNMGLTILGILSFVSLICEMPLIIISVFLLKILQEQEMKNQGR